MLFYFIRIMDESLLLYQKTQVRKTGPNLRTKNLLFSASSPTENKRFPKHTIYPFTAPATRLFCT